MNVIGVTCSCLPKSLSQKAVKAFLQGAEEAGHHTLLVPIGKGLSGCTGCHACKKLYPIFAQGAPDNPKYRANYEELLRPFDGWGFERMEPLVVTGPTSEEAIHRAYELGRAI